MILRGWGGENERYFLTHFGNGDGGLRGNNSLLEQT